MGKMIDNYSLHESIGEGNYGKVYRGTNSKKSGDFAIKVIPFEKFAENIKLEDFMLNEVQILSTIGNNEHIVRYFEMLKTKNNYYFIYEYCNGGTLHDAIRQDKFFTQRKALSIFRQLQEAFKTLNRFNIMHRDLKPENIFFNDGKAKLGDFGFCKSLKPHESMARTMLGSPIYMAPEVLKGDPYTTKADIWSLGVILYEMLFGECPFESKSIAMLINTINNQEIVLPLQKNEISQKTQTLLRKMLTKDYFRRISWVQLFSYRISEQGEFLQTKMQESLGSIGLARSSFNNKSGTFRNQQDSQTQQPYGFDQPEVKRDKSIEWKCADLQVNPPSGMNSSSGMKDENDGDPKKDRKYRFYSQKYMDVFALPSPGDRNPDKRRESFQDQSNAQRDHPDHQRQTLQKRNSLEGRREQSESGNPKIIDNPNEISAMRRIQEDFAAVRHDQKEKNNSSLGTINTYKTVEIQRTPSLDRKSYIEKELRQEASQSRVPSAQKGSMLEAGVPRSPFRGSNTYQKRGVLLLKHEWCVNLIQKALQGLETRQFQAIPQSYVALRQARDKLTEIISQIGTFETDLLDVSSLINYQIIQIDRQLIQTKQQLLKRKMEIPRACGLHEETIQQLKLRGNARGFVSPIQNQ